ncbi:MAG: SDR family NAD(P)-dependent oxidoreductase [Nitrososphaera sp.]|jgi:UDP-glucose 4-epimerase
MHNIIVTGGSGFIGRHLVKKLSRENYKVTVIDRLADTDGKSGDSPYVKNGVTYYRADIRDYDVMDRIFAKENARSCVHLAALISVADSVRDPASTIDVNINGTANVLRACSEHGIQNYVFASTGAAYGEPKQFPIVEEHVLDPLSPYGASKVAGEVLAASYRNCGKIPNCTSLRFFNVYGEGQSAAYAGVITVFADRLSKGLAPIINGDGLQTRDFVFVEDVANAVMLAVEAGDKKGLSGRFNIATGRSVTINELARTMIRIFGLDLEPQHREALLGDVRYAQVDISAAKKALGYAPQASLEESLASMLAPRVKGLAQPA